MGVKAKKTGIIMGLRRAFLMNGRFFSDNKGVAAIEFAIVSFPFFLLLTALIEVSIFFFAGQMLESVADKVGRKIRTGQLDSTLTAAQLKTEVCNEAAILFDCGKILVDLNTAATFSGLGAPPGPTAGVLVPGNFGFSAPAAEKIMRITVTYEWKVFANFVAAHFAHLNSGNALITAISIFRTEPYS